MYLLNKVFNSEIKGIDEKEMTLTAYVSTDTVDRMGDILDPAGVDLGNYKKNPVVLWAHDYTKLPIGKAQWIKRDGNGILSKVKFASHEFAQEVFQLYKEGFLKAFSVGFIPKEWEDKENKKGAMNRVYTKWEMLEYSAVPVPANPDAVALALSKGLIKNADLKAMLEVKNDEPIQEFNNEVSNETVPANLETKDISKKENKEANPLDELMAENELLYKQMESLEKENQDLKYRLYVALKEKQDSLSEITADNVVKRIEDVTRGVIRKAQGKID